MFASIGFVRYFPTIDRGLLINIASGLIHYVLQQGSGSLSSGGLFFVHFMQTPKQIAIPLPIKMFWADPNPGMAHTLKRG
jgi:hypothetical protein